MKASYRDTLCSSYVNMMSGGGTCDVYHIMRHTHSVCMAGLLGTKSKGSAMCVVLFPQLKSIQQTIVTTASARWDSTSVCVAHNVHVGSQV